MGTAAGSVGDSPYRATARGLLTTFWRLSVDVGASPEQAIESRDAW